MAQPRRPRCMPLPALGLALALAALGGAQKHAAWVPGNAEDQALDAAEKICASELDAFAACMEQEIEGQRAEHPSDAMQRCEDVHRIQGLSARVRPVHAPASRRPPRNRMRQPSRR